MEHLDARLNALDERIASLERCGFEHRITALETELARLRADIGEILRSVHRIEVQEREREVSMLRDLLRVAITGGAGGGAVGTAAYAMLQVLGAG